MARLVQWLELVFTTNIGDCESLETGSIGLSCSDKPEIPVPGPLFFFSINHFKLIFKENLDNLVRRF